MFKVAVLQTLFSFQGQSVPTEWSVFVLSHSGASVKQPQLSHVLSQLKKILKPLDWVKMGLSQQSDNFQEQKFPTVTNFV